MYIYELFLLVCIILLVYYLIFLFFPKVIKKVFSASNKDKSIIPSTKEKYKYSDMISSLLLFTIVIVFFSWGPENVGLVYTENALHIGLIGAAFMSVFVSLFMMFMSNDGKAQANELGLNRPLDFVIHSTWYSFVWAGYREELFYRGFVQTKTVALLGTIWGLLVPLLYFSFDHAMNSKNVRVAIVWILSTIPGSMVFTFAYYLSESLIAPIIAHGVNNCVAGLLVYLALYKPQWRKVAATIIGMLGLVIIISQMKLLKTLIKSVEFDILHNFEYGILTLMLLLLGTWTINRVHNRLEVQ